MLALKFIIGILLIPLCWVSFATFFLLFKSEASAGAFFHIPEFFFFLVGGIIALLIFRSARRSPALMWLYVAGHELTHALFVMVCRGRVTKVHITATEGGHIHSDTNNFLVSLSPYFFPFYTVLSIGLWALVEWLFVDFSENQLFWLYGLIGLTWTFHIAYSIRVLQHQQSDITYNGKLFSYTFIFLINTLVISCLLIIASPSVTFASYGKEWLGHFETMRGLIPQTSRWR